MVGGEVSPLDKGAPGPQPRCVRGAARNDPASFAPYPNSSRSPGSRDHTTISHAPLPRTRYWASASGGSSLRSAPSIFSCGLATPVSRPSHPGIRSSPSPGFASFSQSGTLSPGVHRGGAGPLALAHCCLPTLPFLLTLPTPRQLRLPRSGPWSAL